MLIPAICKKEELIKAFDRLRYTDKAMYFNGCIEDGRIYIQDDESSYGRFQYAVCDKDENLIGYMGFSVDYYSQNAYGFGLISFLDHPSKYISQALREAIKILYSMDLHRIEFVSISSNPACKRYDNLITTIGKRSKVSTRKIISVHTFKDRSGKWLDTYKYEIIFWKNYKEQVVELTARGVYMDQTTKDVFDNGFYTGYQEGEYAAFCKIVAKFPETKDYVSQYIRLPIEEKVNFDE